MLKVPEFHPRDKGRGSWAARWRQGWSAANSPEEFQGGQEPPWQHRRGTTQPDRDMPGNSDSRTADQERPHFCIQLLSANTPQLGFGNTKMIQHKGLLHALWGQRLVVYLTELAGSTPCHAEANLEPCRREVWDLPKAYRLVLLVLLCRVCQRYVQSTSGTNVTRRETVGSLLECLGNRCV